MSERVLSATGVSVVRRRRPMLPPTDVVLHPGEVRAVVGEPGSAHVALALVLAGRLAPNTGTVLLDGSPGSAARQRAVALVDVPEVSEPDDVVPIGTVLGEELAMARLPARRRAVRAWAPHVDLAARTEDVPAGLRTSLLLHAAARRPGVRFLVLTLPDRWGVTPAQWQPVAAELALSGLGILVTVGLISQHLLAVPHSPLGFTGSGGTDDGEAS